MQIYEITSKKTVTEAAPGSVGAKAGIVGKGFMGAITQKLLPGANPNTPGGGTVAPGQRANAAFDVNSPQVALLATKAEASWLETLKAAMAASRPPALNASQLKAPEVEQDLDANVSSLLGFNIKNINSWQGEEGAKHKQWMSDAKDAVIKASIDPNSTPEQMKQAWLEMARTIMNAQIAEEFMSQGPAATPGVQPPVTLGPRGEVLIGKQTARVSDPDQLEQMKAMKAALEKLGV
jgi:hypothetical protein